MTELRVHYLEKSQKEAIVDQARKTKDGAFYRSQGAYTFAWFTTDLEEVFTTLDNYNKPVLKGEKLQLLCEKIKTDNASFNGKAKVGARVSSVDIAKKLSKELQSHTREEKEQLGINKKKPGKLSQQNKGKHPKQQVKKLKAKIKKLTATIVSIQKGDKNAGDETSNSNGGSNAGDGDRSMEATGPMLLVVDCLRRNLLLSRWAMMALCMLAKLKSTN
eukprot:14170650-Ditylum_brightwellii.AAC.2